MIITKEMEKAGSDRHGRLTVQTLGGDIDGFTSLLQAGIRVRVRHGSSIGALLTSLPGFTARYINEEVQTIFLDGSATDDLATPLFGTTHVLAISAAMPGLAGAIFRRNSLHASLRTVNPQSAKAETVEEVIVKLKLFNTIARDRGKTLLREGVWLTSADLSQFLDNRASLIAKITDLVIDGTAVPASGLMAILPQFDTVRLTFTC
ncbi:MAG: hypothetical protein ACK5PS_04160 [Desulfopila sp.]